MSRQRILFFAAVILLIVAGLGYVLFERWEREARAVDDGVVASKNGDYQTAITLLTPYAESGNKLAQRTIGMAYAYGQGVTRDRQRAHTLLQASQGEKAVSTYVWIAKSFESGDGVTADPAEAVAWYEIAANEGSAEARDHLQRMRETRAREIQP